MTTLKQIEEFIAAEPIALIGVSRNPKKFGYSAFKELKEKGMNIIPVNPYAAEILGAKAFPDVKSLSDDVKGIIIMTKKEQTVSVVREAMAKGLKQIWIQQMADTPEVKKALDGTDINFITGECILMHYKPHGIHKFHAKLKRFFGRFPK